jgi:hypothetical protein
MGTDAEIERAMAWERQPKFEREPDMYALGEAAAIRNYEAEQMRQAQPAPPPQRRSSGAYVMAFIYAFVFWRAMWNLAFGQQKGGFLSLIRRYK